MNTSFDVTSPVGDLIAEARENERIGRLQEARAVYERALTMLDNAGGVVSAAALLRWIGGTLRGEGKIDAALGCYQASLSVAESCSSAIDMAHAHNWLGIVEQERGRMDNAIARYHKAYRLAASAKDQRLVALVRQNLGAAFSIQGDLERGIRHFTKSLECYRALGDEEAASRVLNNLGLVHVDLESYDVAEKNLAEASRLCERTGDLRTRAMIEVNRIDLAVRTGNLNHALKVCDRARLLASSIDHQIALGEIYKWYGIIYREKNIPQVAQSHLEAALELAKKHDNRLLEGEVHRELALLFRATEQNRAALESLNRAHKIFSDLRAQRMLSDIGTQMLRLEEIFVDVVERWANSIEENHHYTHGHCERVADYSCMIARAAGMTERQIAWFRMGAFLHDVGKTAIPGEILNKEGPLSAEEWAIMKQHTILGVELLSGIEFPWDIRPMVLSHHERWDGDGYPDQLAGEHIPVEARMLAIADAYDALTTTRAYRKAFTPEAALAKLRPDAGSAFDPQLFALFEAELSKRQSAAHDEPDNDILKSA